MIDEITEYDQKDRLDLDGLMHELSATSGCDEATLKAAVNDPNTHIYIIREQNSIVATGTLCLKHTLEFALADIESVVVSSKQRGKGYGKLLLQHMIAQAQAYNVHHIQLTSNPKRVAANKLYQKLGFERYETNCYKYYFL
jgi:ribosomal protein S18 acetylase RimI-like enzyme